MTSAIRLRRLLAEDRPIVGGYDRAVFVRVLHYADRPIDAAADAISAARRMTAEILGRMPDADWAHEGTPTDSGRYTAEDWLRISVTHGHEHAAQMDAVVAFRENRHNKLKLSQTSAVAGLLGGRTVNKVGPSGP